MSVALVMTVRNERELLRTNLLYHHFAGVELAIVYDDGSDDDTVATLEDLRFVSVRHSVDAARFAGRADLAAFVRAHEAHLAARQALNFVDAMEIARAEGMSWLISLDADELATTDLTVARPNGLAEMLGELPARVEALVMLPLEVLQRRFDYSDVFAEETLFKRSDTPAQRLTYDPFAGRTRQISVLYGHAAGKSAIRVGSGAIPRTAHRFTGAGGRTLTTVTSGHLLHYYCHDFAAFVSKFRLMKDHPDQHVHGGAVVLQKKLWRDVINRAGLSDEELRDYYMRWVMFDDAEVERLGAGRRRFLPHRSPLVEVTSVRDALAGIRDTTGAA